MTDVDSFLAHYGVRGMKWGVRKASVTNSSDIFKNKDVESLIQRRQKEAELEKLIKEDLYPNRTAAKKFVNDLLMQHKGVLLSGAATAGSIALGTAFMAYRLSQGFKGVSISPIPLGR